MPVQNIDYSKTIIYKIVSIDLNIKDVYIGSTTNFKERKSSHKRCSKSVGACLKVYKTIQLNGGWDNWEMIEIEKYPCLDHNEATKRERYYYELLNANLNMVSPNRQDVNSNKHATYHCIQCNLELCKSSKNSHERTSKHKFNNGYQ